MIISLEAIDIGIHTPGFFTMLAQCQAEPSAEQAGTCPMPTVTTEQISLCRW